MPARLLSCPIATIIILRESVLLFTNYPLLAIRYNTTAFSSNDTHAGTILLRRLPYTTTAANSKYTKQSRFAYAQLPSPKDTSIPQFYSLAIILRGFSAAAVHLTSRFSFPLSFFTSPEISDVTCFFFSSLSTFFYSFPLFSL